MSGFIEPCPACPKPIPPIGAKMADIRASSGDLHGWQVCCDACGTAGPVRRRLGQAIDDWNAIRRTAATTP